MIGLLMKRLAAAFKPTRPKRSDTIYNFVGNGASQLNQEFQVADTRDKAKFKIRLAHDDKRNQDALHFVRERYRSAGLLGECVRHGPAQERITLMAYHEHAVVGSATLGIDSHRGLLADAIYKPEIDNLRAEGSKVCEITKLAVNHAHASQQIIATLFNIIYIYAREIYECDDAIIEVNPRHTAFYKKKVGFTTWGNLKHCERVDAPAELLRLDLGWVEKRVAAVGGKKGLLEHNDPTLYPMFFLLPQQSEIVGHIKMIERRHVHA